MSCERGAIMNDEKMRSGLGVAYRFDLITGQNRIREVRRGRWFEFAFEVKLPS
jgi:hypothetical protein